MVGSLGWMTWLLIPSPSRRDQLERLFTTEEAVETNGDEGDTGRGPDGMALAFFRSIGRWLGQT